MVFVKNTRLNIVNFVKKERRDACFTLFLHLYLEKKEVFMLIRKDFYPRQYINFRII